MSVTTILESLQSQIQSKTSILPSLYAQLGLPSTTLADELSTLQSKLTACVDEVVNGRKQEVEMWMNKCREVERKIEAYKNAIGNSNSSSTMTAIPDSIILSIRFESLSSHHDKLQHVYRSKLDQFNSLRARLANYTRILGEDFLCYVISSDESFADNDLLRDLTPEQFSKLEKDMVRSKNEVSRRLNVLGETFEHISWLHSELGIALPSPDPFLATTQSQSSTRTSEVEAEEKAIAFVRVLTTFLSASDRATSLDSVEPTNELMDWVDRFTTELEQLKDKREIQIQGMYDQLEMLWRRLGIDDNEIDDFVEAWRGSTEAVIEAYECELERMLELKRSTMSTFIGNARAEIESLWNELMYSDEERSEFFPYQDEEHTEELLAIHEEEIMKLKEELKSKARLLASVKKYSEICEEEQELAAAASDQSRLLGRGPRDPGRLLREEKMRKRVMKEKPRLEQDLLASIGHWEAEHRKRFMINGIPFLETLAEKLDSASNEKENKKRVRPNVVPARGVTPAPTANGRPTPGPTPGGASNKKQKLDGTTAPQSIRLNMTTPTPFTGRPVLGSRNGLMNMATPTPYGLSQKTPGSSLPRPKTFQSNAPPLAMPIPVHPPPHNQYAALGMGIPNSLVKPQPRAISSSSVLGTSQRRRESFRPRASTDNRNWNGDPQQQRYAGLGESLVEVEVEGEF